MRLERAVPVVQVTDVGRSMAWYGYRICVSGAVPAGADVPAARECEETSR
jgi:hypothetical protein